MKLTELVRLIEHEAAVARRIEAEIALYSITETQSGMTPLRHWRRAFAGSLRQTAKALGVSPTYLSLCERGKAVPSRRLILRLHETYGLAAEAEKEVDDG